MALGCGQRAARGVRQHSTPSRSSFVLLAGRVPEVNEAIKDMGIRLRSKLGLSDLPQDYSGASDCSNTVP